LGINLHHIASARGFMGHHGSMRTQLEVGTDDAAYHLHPPVTSFRSRRSALTPAQQRTWERLWPRLGTEARTPDGPAGLLDTGRWFGRSAPIVLEVGCGTGTSTAAMAQAEPQLDVVAVEVYRRGLAQLLGSIDRDNITNVRMIRGDGLDVLEHMFGPESLVGVRVFFSDPWPKARHHKRRFLQPRTVALIADRLVPGGVLHAATDHRGYAEQIADAGDAEPRLRRADPDAHLAISVRRPATKYETKAREAGNSVAELLWEKRQS
jgi:tRNA (guanine-N7-)-methyltransferase